MRQSALIAALHRLMRPLVRIMIRNGISSSSAEEVLRKTFVDVAAEEFALPNRKQSDSRISVLTGLTRKQVARYRAMDATAIDQEIARHNRAERVIAAWLREPDFVDEKGDPRALPFSGRNSFSDLIVRFAGDVPLRAVADELLRVGNVAMDEYGYVRLLVRGYRPGPLSEEAVFIFGTHARDFLSTLDNNLAARRPEDLLLQRQVTYSKLPVATIGEFKQLSARLAQRSLEDLDQWLAAQKQKSAADEGDTVRLAFGVYQVVTPDEDTKP